MRLTIFSDGGARGNPGPAAVGVVIKNERGQVVSRVGKCIGETTNNQAEYQAVILAFEKAHELGGTELSFNLDSELVVKQLNGEYKIKNQELAQQFLKIWNWRKKFKTVDFNHIYREKNTEADALVNEALDSLKSKVKS